MHGRYVQLRQLKGKKGLFLVWPMFDVCMYVSRQRYSDGSDFGFSWSFDVRQGGC